MANELEQLIEKIKNASKTEYYKLKLIKEEDDKPELFDSKFGGNPYWVPEMDYPVNNDGEKLAFLAQINFDKFEFEPPLPSKGMLQFFIGFDDLNGLDFDDMINQNDFRVIYHEDIDYTITEESIKHKIRKMTEEEEEEFPVQGEFKLEICKSEDYDYINSGVAFFDNIFAETYKEVYHKELKENEYYFKVLNSEESDILDQKLKENVTGHKILGYPFFTQTDPREDKKYSEYDTLLLQIDTDGDDIIWGDSGVCNFFIKKEDLLKKDFSHVLYNWDCC